MGHNGLAQTIRPVHTPWDGDTLFALGTGKSGLPADMMLLSTLATEVTALAVLSAWRFMAHAVIVWQLLQRPTAEMDIPAAAPLILRGA
jgi:L-aminopeptidase/D-esterase-like protein